MIPIGALAKINAMRNVIATLIFAGVLCIPAAVSAQVNYDLLPGYGDKHGYPPKVTYRAWVLSYRDSKYYSCSATYDRRPCDADTCLWAKGARSSHRY